MKTKGFFILVFGFLFTSLSAQKYDVKKYTVNEGMPSGQVYDIDFTKDGYVWFSTSFGLVKSDGKSFKTYDRKNGLREEIINNFHIDSQENFWVASYGTGVGILENDSLIYPQYLDSLKSSNVNFIVEGPNNAIWFGTNERGVWIWNPSDQKLKPLELSASLPDKTIWDIYFDKQGNTWISTHKGVVVVDQEENEIFRIDNNSGLNGTVSYHVFEDSKGNKWISSDKGVTIVDSDFSSRNISELNGTELGYVYNVSEDKYGRVWIGTERKGVFWYTPEETIHVTKENGLSSNYIYRFIKDKDGTIWVATEGNGVTVFKDTRFTIYNKDTEFGANEVYGVLKDRNGTLWFANQNKLTSNKNGKFTSYPFPDGYEDEEVWDLEELDNGDILLLTYEKPILKFDGTQFTPFKFEGVSSPYYITDIFQDDNGDFLLSGEGGVIVYNDGIKDTIKVSGDDYWASYVNSIFKDSENTYWFGTVDGVVKYDGKQQKRFNKNNGVNGSSVFEIKEGPLGNIWIGTNRGISVLTKSVDKDSIKLVRSFEIDERYLAETIFLQFDGQIGIWQGTNAGLNYFDLHSWDSLIAKNIHFPLQEFGRGVEFNGSASLMDDEGNLWFGTASNGVIKFDFIDKERYSIFQKAPDIYIRDLASNSNSLWKAYSNGERIVLDFDQNNIDIGFGSSNLKEPNRMLYKYRLNGFDEKFYFASDINNVYYTSLNPGKYLFEVYAKSPNSGWSLKPAVVDFLIEKPFWLRWWFIVIIVLFTAFLLAIIVKLRVEYLKKRKLSKLVDEQTKELQAGLEEKEVLIKEIHHRVKNNLAVISGLLEMQSWNLESEDAKKALEESKLRVLAIAKIHENLYQNKDLGKIDFESFLLELKSGIVSAMHTNRDIDVQIEVRSGLIQVNQAIPCGLIINELITNSFKHAFNDQQEKVIKVNFIEEDDHFELTVQDNGIGISPDVLETSKSSLGISLIKSLSTQLEGSLSIENDNGAVFKLKIPKKVISSST
jgi:two-component sensor histidine kinase/ligand-binding sensor domain-containing protein